MLSTKIGMRIASPGYHKVAFPNLEDLAATAASVHVIPDEILVTYFCADEDSLTPEEIREEFAECRSELAGRYARRSLVYPVKWGLEESSSFLLYGITRLLKPQTVLETGVANGHSTFLLLKALEANGKGHLHSVDVGRDVGGLLERERANWSLNVLDTKDPSRSFSSLLDALPSLDLFLHDSDHSYRWQEWELSCITPKLSSGGVVAFDDADSSWAFLDHCANSGTRPVLLLDRRKVFGVLMSRGATPLPSGLVAP